MSRLTLIFASLAILICSSLQAVEPRRPGLFAKSPAPPMPPYSKQAQVGAMGRAMYPKYYFGLHAREFQNVGIPHGDIGVTGSGLTRNPW